MFYFFLGNTPDLSLLELKTLYPGKFELVAKEIASYDSDLDLTSLSRLGGSRKVAQALAVIAPADLSSKLIELIKADPAKNIAITDYADLSIERSLFHVIKSGVDRSLRFVSLDTSEHELLMLAHQHVSEFNLIPRGDLLVIAKTVWIYDAEDWVSRDRKKPYRDIKRGMLPPKVARIMVNLATGGKSGLTLADPFCGTGTVLAEAIMVGEHVLGSDTNPEAIPGSESNLKWILSTPGIVPTTYRLKVADATHFHETFPSVDAVATEPYMGPLLDERNPLSLDKIKNIAKGLDKLYRGAFKSFALSLPRGGRIVMSIPSFAVYNRVIQTISIDTLTSLGYNYISAVPYSKPGGIVIRNITILEKK
jgi:tRNA G10  N-methylase Trm11